MTRGVICVGKSVVKGEECRHETIHLLKWLSEKLISGATPIKAARYRTKRAEIAEVTINRIENGLRQGTPTKNGGGNVA